MIILGKHYKMEIEVGWALCGFKYIGKSAMFESEGAEGVCMCKKCKCRCQKG